MSLPKDFFLDKVEKLLSGCGYLKDNKGKTTGSRVVFKSEYKRPIMLYKPYLDNIVKSLRRQVFDDLREAGFVNEANKVE